MAPSQNDSSTTSVYLGELESIEALLPLASNLSTRHGVAALMIIHELEYLLNYIIGVSAGIAIINSIPIPFLDGSDILENSLIVLYPAQTGLQRRKFRRQLTTTTTVLALLYVVNSVLRLSHRH